MKNFNILNVLTFKNNKDIGTSKNPIIISSKTRAVKIEYEILHHILGKHKEDWLLLRQELIVNNTSFIDKLYILTKDGKMDSFYFDITASFEQ